MTFPTFEVTEPSARSLRGSAATCSSRFERLLRESAWRKWESIVGLEERIGDC